MANRKPAPLATTNTRKESANVAMPEKPAASIQRRQIANGDWVGADLIDVASTTSRNGTYLVNYTFEVTAPKIYRGVKLYLTLHEGLDKSLDPENPNSIAAQFPGVDLLDENSAWDAISGVPLRVHVGHKQLLEVDEETGESKVTGIGYRVTSFRPDDRKRVD